MVNLEGVHIMRNEHIRQCKVCEKVSWRGWEKPSPGLGRLTEYRMAKKGEKHANKMENWSGRGPKSHLSKGWFSGNRDKDTTQACATWGKLQSIKHPYRLLTTLNIINY
jgi:hypothetical protein